MFADPSELVRRAAPEAVSTQRSMSRQDDGFTLIELLIVVLVIGILAAIAVPMFLSDTGKAKDAQAKELARTAQTTAETISTEDGGSYAKVDPTELAKIEPSISIVAGSSEAYVSAATGSENEYSVTATSPNGDELTIKKNASGELSRECASPIEKTGCSGGESSSW